MKHKHWEQNIQDDFDTLRVSCNLNILLNGVSYAHFMVLIVLVTFTK